MSIGNMTPVQITKERLTQIPSLISGYESKKILVVGDVGLDEYVMGEVRRISPEAPVPIVEVEHTEFRLGLAANVAQNIRTLGGVPEIISVVGQDGASADLRKLCEKSGVDTRDFVVDESRPTTRKTRVLGKQHHIVRVDYEIRKSIATETENLLIKKCAERVRDCDAIILQDYAKGVVTDRVASELTAICRSLGKPVLVDPHRSRRVQFYKGCALIKPNLEEALSLVNIDYENYRENPELLHEVGARLLKIADVEQAVVTLGKDGMAIFTRTESLRVPTFAKNVFDVTGAGDTVISALALGMASGVSLAENCMISNFAAGVVVAQVGCIPCTRAELLSAVEDALSAF